VRTRGGSRCGRTTRGFGGRGVSLWVCSFSFWVRSVGGVDEAQKKSGDPYTSLNPEDAQPLADAFAAKYPGVTWRSIVRELSIVSEDSDGAAVAKDTADVV
jgi:hypothetical protein